MRTACIIQEADASVVLRRAQLLSLSASREYATLQQQQSRSREYAQAVLTLTSKELPSAAPGSKSDPAPEDDEFLDPISWELIVDPVVCSDGRTYDRC